MVVVKRNYCRTAILLLVSAMGLLLFFRITVNFSHPALTDPVPKEVDLPNGVIQVLNLHWDSREGLVLERTAHNVLLQQGTVEFRDLDGWKDGLSFSLEQRFQESHTDQAYDYLKNKASSGNQILGLVDYCHFYYLIYWDSGTVYIDEPPAITRLGSSHCLGRNSVGWHIRIKQDLLRGGREGEGWPAEATHFMRPKGGSYVSQRFPFWSLLLLIN